MRRSYYLRRPQLCLRLSRLLLRRAPILRHVPAVYYGRPTNGWAYNPWPAPVAYGWGWAAPPGTDTTEATLLPLRFIPTSTLAYDYLLAANLQAAYEATAAAGALNVFFSAVDGQPAWGGGDEAPTTLTPELKEKIAQEIKIANRGRKRSCCASRSCSVSSVSSHAASGDQKRSRRNAGRA